MEPAPAGRGAPGPASLVVVDPNGHRTRVSVDPIPFLIGRQPENHLIVRDSRVSRTHARILVENAQYVLEDSGSRHGTDRKSTRLNSSHGYISYAVFCLKKKKYPQYVPTHSPHSSVPWPGPSVCCSSRL